MPDGSNKICILNKLATECYEFFLEQFFMELNCCSTHAMYDKSLICQNKISSEIFFNKKIRINFDQGFFIWLEFCQASGNRSDSQVASQYFKNDSCE